MKFWLLINLQDTDDAGNFESQDSSEEGNQDDNGDSIVSSFVSLFDI